MFKYRRNEFTHQHDLCHQGRCKELRWYSTQQTQFQNAIGYAQVLWFVCILRCHLCRSQAIRTKRIQMYKSCHTHCMSHSIISQMPATYAELTSDLCLPCHALHECTTAIKQQKNCNLPQNNTSNPIQIQKTVCSYLSSMHNSFGDHDSLTSATQGNSPELIEQGVQHRVTS